MLSSEVSSNDSQPSADDGCANINSAIVNKSRPDSEPQPQLQQIQRVIFYIYEWSAFAMGGL